MIDTKQKQHSQFLFFIFLFATASILTQNNAIIIAYAILIFLTSAFNLQLGIFAWMLVAPLSNSIDIDFIFYIFTSAIALPYLFKLVSGKELIRKSILNRHIFITFFLLVLSSTFFYIDSFHTLILHIGVYITAFIIFQQSTKNKEGISYVIYGFILSGVIATVYAFLLRDEDTVRLRIGDNVRSLANIINFSLIFIFYFFVVKENNQWLTKNLLYKIINRFKWIITAAMVAGLVATASRGAIIAIATAVIAMFVINIFSNIRQFNAKRTAYSVLIMGAVLGISLNYGDKILDLFNVSSGLVEARFSEEHFESGSSIRTQIWLSAINQLDGLKLYIGHGLGSFWYLADRAGFPGFNSHSVFVDIIVSTGILGFLSLMSVFSHIAYNSFKKNQLTLLSLLLLLILNFITHGGIGSPMFWSFLAILLAIVFYVKKQSE